MKKFSGFNKGLIYALVTSMVISCASGIGPLRANAATTGTVNADALNVRSGAGTGYSRVGTVTQGQTLSIEETIQGSDGYTWYKVSGAVSGYVRGDYISNVVSDTPTRPTSSAGTITADWLNVRTGAGTNFSRMGSVAQGTRLTVISVHGEWYKITCQMDGVIQTGYVHSQYVQMDGSSGNTGSQGNTGNPGNTGGTTPTPATGTGVVNVDALNVRGGASTSDTILGLIRQNESVEILASEGSWYKIRCSINGNTQEGYVYAEYISKTSGSSNPSTDPAPSTGKGVVNADALNVRTGAGTNHSSIGLIRKNEQVEIIGQSGSWYQVKCKVNGSETTGYVSAEYITRINESGGGSTTPEPEPTPSYEKKNGVVNADALNVRTGAGTNHSAIGLIYQNASVTVIGEENGWYKVSCVVNGANREGYVSAEYITIVDSSSGNPGTTNPGTTNPGGNVDVTGKTGITTADGLNFRTGPGTNYSTQGLVYLGTQVNILGEEGDWYKVSCVVNGVIKTGYMSKEFVRIAGSNDTPYEGPTDAQFEEQLAAFPESYRNALRHLHAQHPSWSFTAKYTGIDFNYAVDQENSGNRSMIYVSSTTPFSWLSTAPGDYDWATDTYVNKDGSSWKGASRELIAYYMDPRNFLDEQQIFMFESQSYETSQSRVVTAGILGGTFMADGNGYYYNGRYYSYIDTFMEAGQIAGVSPYFLASRVRQEVGGGSSAVDGSYGYYNFFNIGAYASASGNAVQNGMNYAAQTGTWRRPWTSPWLSIVGGAEFLASSYINVGQNTDYFQKFNVVDTPYFDHQYMGNIQAPCTEGTSRYSTYKNLGVLDDSVITFIIPVYDNMPTSAAAIPAVTGNPNSYIKYMSINNGSIGFNQTFTYNKLNYNAVTRESSINISATPVSSYGTIVSGAGYHALNPGNNVIQVVCQAGNGNQTTYTLNIYRQ